MVNAMTNNSETKNEQETSSTEAQIKKAKALIELIDGQEITPQDEVNMMWRMLIDPKSSYNDWERAALFNTILYDPAQTEENRKEIWNIIDKVYSQSHRLIANNLKTNILFVKIAGEDAKLTEENKIKTFKKTLFTEKDRLSYEEEQDILCFFLWNNIPLEGGPVIRAKSS
jgi:hypothetical protein